MIWKLIIAAVVIVGIGGAVYFSGVKKSQVVEAWKSVSGTAEAAEPHPSGPPWKPEPKPEWTGTVAIEKAQRAAIGLRSAEVLAQVEPIKLELTGRTAYDETTLTKIRPRFDTRVEKVYATLGQKIKKGDKLVELFSTELAKAKSDYQTKYVQWRHDDKLLVARTKLHEQGAVSTQQLVDTQNDEQKSRLDYKLAGETLKVLNVPDQDIAPLLNGLDDTVKDDSFFGNVTDKARMTMLAPADGIVIERDVVPGNFYDTSSVLMTIAPLDHLWVWINVYELDQDKVRLNQTMDIQFPFLEEGVRGRVEYVANEVSKDTRAVKVRASVKNPGVHLKADMLVKALLDIAPVKGQTIIPRQAMVTFNGVNYVFVRKAATSSGGKKDDDETEYYERRKIEVSQENTDKVIVRRGIKAGEFVATSGSLILSQMYEDERVVDTGLPDV